MGLFKSERGMSLVSVMAAAAIGAILSLAIAQLITDGFKSQRAIQQRQAALNVQTGVLDFLSDRTACNANFLNVLATTTSAVPGLRKPDNTPAISLNTPMENGMVQLSAMSLGNLRRRNSAGLDMYRGGMTLSLTILRNDPDNSGIRELNRSVELAVVLKGYNGQAPANEILSCVAVGNDTNNPWVTTPDLNIIYQGNNVGIGVPIPSQKLQVNGNILASSFLYPSDRRLKKNFVTLQSVGSLLSQLKTFQFDWVNGGETTVGLIAQDLESLIPSAVKTDSVTSLKSIDYSQVTAISIQAINELREENDQLKERLKRIELKLDSLTK